MQRSSLVDASILTYVSLLEQNVRVCVISGPPKKTSVWQIIHKASIIIDKTVILRFHNNHFTLLIPDGSLDLDDIVRSLGEREFATLIFIPVPVFVPVPVPVDPAMNQQILSNVRTWAARLGADAGEQNPRRKKAKGRETDEESAEEEEGHEQEDEPERGKKVAKVAKKTARSKKTYTGVRLSHLFSSHLISSLLVLSPG